jgi:hypothetical protein
MPISHMGASDHSDTFLRKGRSYIALVTGLIVSPHQEKCHYFVFVLSFCTFTFLCFHVESKPTGLLKTKKKTKKTQKSTDTFPDARRNSHDESLVVNLVIIVDGAINGFSISS